MPLTITLIDNDRDYEASVLVRSTDYDFSPITVDEARAHDSTNAPDLIADLYLGRDEHGEARVSGRLREMRQNEGKVFYFEIAVMDWRNPVEWLEIYRFLYGRAIKAGATIVMTSTRDNRACILQAIANEGLTHTQTNPMSCLDVADFDRSKFAQDIAKVKNSGVEILPLTEYQQRVGPAWEQGLWELIDAVLPDIPSPVPIVVTYEEHEKYVQSEAFHPETRFLAVENGKILGLSEFDIKKANPKLAMTQLTGVRKDARRRGLATALKAEAIAYAKQQGVEKIYTDNEENNPMYQLNLALGFKHAWDWLMFKKTLTPASQAL